MQYLILIAVFLWLLYETDFMRIRLPAGMITDTWHDELPFDTCYQDIEFTESAYDTMISDLYDAWLIKYHEPKLVYCPADKIQDYPQYEYLNNIDKLDKIKRHEMIWQRGKR